MINIFFHIIQYLAIKIDESQFFRIRKNIIKYQFFFFSIFKSKLNTWILSEAWSLACHHDFFQFFLPIIAVS